MKKYGWLFLALLLLPGLALADTASTFNNANASLALAVQSITGTLQTKAIQWLSAFMLLQFILTNLNLLKSGADIQAVWAKALGSLFWFGFCYWAMENGPQLIANVSNGFFTTASEISGGGGTFDAADIISKGCGAAADLIAQVTDASSYISLVPAVIIAGLLGIAVVLVSGFIAFKVFLLKVEAMLIVMMAPMSMTFMALQATKDQGIAPFKSLISLIYRIILLAVILAALKSVGQNLDTVIASVNKDSWASGMWGALFSATVAYTLLGFLAYKSDSMAANLASGSTSLGTNDAAMGAAMGAAVGAALVSGGVAAAGGTTSKVQSMADFMKNLNTGGGEIKNAGPGSGGGNPYDQQPVGLAEYQASLAESKARAGGGDSSSAAGLGGGEKSGFDMSSQGAAPRSTGSAGGATSSPSTSDASTPSGSPAQDKPLKGMDEATRARSRAWAAKHSEGNPAFAAQKAAETGSGATAGIGSAGSGLEQKLGDLVDTLSKPKNPTLSDRLGAVNDHVAREGATTSVSVNTHHSDH